MKAREAIVHPIEMRAALRPGHDASADAVRAATEYADQIKYTVKAYTFGRTFTGTLGPDAATMLDAEEILHYIGRADKCADGGWITINPDNTFTGALN